MNFLIDNHLPEALGHWLIAEGHTAIHVRKSMMNRASDLFIWEHAANNNCVIITKDEDFPDMALLRPEFVPVIWLRIGNCRKKALLEFVAASWPKIFQQLQSGDQIIEVH